VSGRLPISGIKDGKIAQVDTIDLKARWPEKWEKEWLGW
jgi:branched-chain amino acid transport system substrate-binding protein